MRISFLLRFVAGLGVLFLALSLSHGNEPDGKSVWQLQRDVAERERQVNRSERDLAEARARLAFAEKNRDTAIKKLRTTVSCCQRELQWILDHAKWFCDPREMLTAAERDLANARVRLAETEADPATLVTELKKIVAFHERSLQTMQRLEQMRAVRPEEIGVAQEALGKARQRLQVAEKRLSQKRAKKLQESR